MHLKKLND
jgi:peptide chain release factor 1